MVNVSFQCEYFVCKYKQRYTSTMVHVLIHNLGHSIAIIEEAKTHQGL